jgi:hypothetical protein
MPAKTFPVA